MATKMQFTVWWVETDKVTGKPSRVYRDFRTQVAALLFAANQEIKLNTLVTTDRISNCPWHHQHASI